jgi:hypothetical protein
MSAIARVVVGQLHLDVDCLGREAERLSLEQKAQLECCVARYRVPLLVDSPREGHRQTAKVSNAGGGGYLDLGRSAAVLVCVGVHRVAKADQLVVPLRLRRIAGPVFVLAEA